MQAGVRNGNERIWLLSQQFQLGNVSCAAGDCSSLCLPRELLNSVWLAGECVINPAGLKRQEMGAALIASLAPKLRL